MTVTAKDLFGCSRADYLLDFPCDEEEAGKAYDMYMAQYEQIATCINNNDVAGIKRLVIEFDMERESLLGFLEMME